MHNLMNNVQDLTLKLKTIYERVKEHITSID